MCPYSQKFLKQKGSLYFKCEQMREKNELVLISSLYKLKKLSLNGGRMVRGVNTLTAQY